MSTGYVINFQDGATGEHIATFAGKEAQYLIDHSDFLYELVETDPSGRTITIPVNFPYGRTQIFKKLLRGYPLGEYIHLNGQKAIQWYPLSEEEEEIIAKGLKNGTLRSTLQKERERVIFEVLHYLMLDSEAETKFLKIDYKNKTKEMNRRRNITKRRQHEKLNQLLLGRNINNNMNLIGTQHDAERFAIPYLNENKIENFIEKHKNYLYATYAPTRRNKLHLLLNKKNVNTRNKMQQKHEKETETRLKNKEKKLKRMIGRNDYNDYERNLQYEFGSARQNPYEGGPYNTNYLSEVNLAPFRNLKLENMSSVDFERYLRSLRREGEEKHLPNQNVSLGNFFGNRNSL